MQSEEAHMDRSIYPLLLDERWLSCWPLPLAWARRQMETFCLHCF